MLLSLVTAGVRGFTSADSELDLNIRFDALIAQEESARFCNELFQHMLGKAHNTIVAPFSLCAFRGTLVARFICAFVVRSPAHTRETFEKDHLACVASLFAFALDLVPYNLCPNGSRLKSQQNAAPFVARNRCAQPAAHSIAQAHYAYTSRPVATIQLDNNAALSKKIRQV